MAATGRSAAQRYRDVRKHSQMLAEPLSGGNAVDLSEIHSTHPVVPAQEAVAKRKTTFDDDGNSVVRANEAVAKRNTTFDDDGNSVVPAKAGTQFSCCDAAKLG
ncbi:MAG: hypothetical protein WA191_21935, partial [Telluria sp.]